jgi:DinB superfamily
MRRTAIAFVVVAVMLCGAGIGRAQDITQADRDRALQYLEQTKKGVVDATAGLSEAQWNFKPSPDRWSVAEVMEHLAVAEDMIRAMDQDKVMKSPVVPLRDAVELKKIDDSVIANVPDRSHKVQAPEPMKPTNRFGSPQEAEKHFLESRATTEEYLKNTHDLRAHTMDSPMGVPLDGYQWILLLTAHSERHTKQILEVKADPNFPKS